jgi:hypothetical protein
VGHQDNGFGAILDSVLDGGEGAGDTLVVGDLGVGLLVEGNVEVDLKGLSSVYFIVWKCFGVVIRG